MASIPQCGVCLEEYHHEDAHRQPHGLRCGHSFCAACVEGLIGSHPHGHPFAVCPTCRRETSQSDVHINYGLRDIVEQLRTATAAAPTDPTTPAVPPSGQDPPLTARQQRQQESDFDFVPRPPNEINATDAPNDQTSPSGCQHEVVQEGTGNVPALNDSVEVDIDVWRDAFDGNNKVFHGRAGVCRVSSLWCWLDEALLQMREGETRRLIDPYGSFTQLRLIGILDS